MLPADGILRAAQRWLRLLERSTFAQAAALLRADPAFTDLSQTQYASALEWLRDVGLLVETEHGPLLADAVSGHRDADARLIFARALDSTRPAWLADADTLVPDADELPDDAAHLAAILGLDVNDAFLSVRQIHGHIDLAERSRVGAAGELALVRALEVAWPGSTKHVARDDDGLGYDIEFVCDGRMWHLEVKSTTRRGRLTIYLSRHEWAVGQLDPAWRLVVVGLDPDAEASAVATVKTTELLSLRSPRDSSPLSRWEAARHEMGPTDLIPGLTFLSHTPPEAHVLLGANPNGFAWMPRQSGAAIGAI